MFLFIIRIYNYNTCFQMCGQSLRVTSRDVILFNNIAPGDVTLDGRRERNLFSLSVIQPIYLSISRPFEVYVGFISKHINTIRTLTISTFSLTGACFTTEIAYICRMEAFYT